MNKKQARRPAKVKVLQDACDILGLEDYSQVPDMVQRLQDVIQRPVYGIVVTWKPLVQGSLAFTPINLPREPKVLLDAARALDLVSSDLAAWAVRLSEEAQQVPEGDE